MNPNVIAKIHNVSLRNEKTSFSLFFGVPDGVSVAVVDNVPILLLVSIAIVPRNTGMWVINTAF